MPVRILPFLACRLFALFAMYAGVNILISEFGHSAFFYTVADVDRTSSHIYAIAYLLSNVLVGVFFWRKADWMSLKISGQYSDSELRSNITSDDIQTAGFTVVGLYVIAQAIGPFGNCFEIILNAVTNPTLLKFYLSNHKVYMPPFIRTASWLAWGLLIFFGAPWLTRVSKGFGKGT